MSLPKIITCYSTVADQESAERLISQLLDSRLIACGVSWPISSQYHWENKALSEEEYVVFLKSSLELKDRLISRMQDFHPYDVPCILIREVECNPGYYNWVDLQTR